MSVSTLESENAQPVAQTQNSELIYRLEDRPPLPQTLFAACQHLLAMFVAVITPALLICQALGLPAQDTQHIISMSLFASGVASIIQIKAWGPVGSGLLSIQGTSFNFVAPLIMGGTALKTGGADVPTMMAALFGTLMLASCTEMVISRVLHLARRIITPLVSGVVVMIIGLSLIQVGLTSIGGGYAAMSDNTFGAPKNLLLAGVVLALIILLNRQRNPYLRVASLVIAMAAGYALAWFMGMLPESNEPMTQELIMVPTPLYYGLGIEWSLLLPLMLVFMITSLETIGDITATSDVSEQPVSGPLYMKRLKGGVLANGLNSFVSALTLNTASLPSLILVPHAVMCQFYLCYACGRRKQSKEFFKWQRLKVRLSGSTSLKVLASLLRLMAAKTCSYTSPLSRVMASKLWLKVRTLSSKFRTVRKVRQLLT